MVFLSEGPLGEGMQSLCYCVYPIQEMEKELLDAAQEGDLIKVKELVGQGCPVNVKDEVTACAHITPQFMSNMAHLKFRVLSFVLIYISKILLVSMLFLLAIPKFPLF